MRLANQSSGRVPAIHWRSLVELYAAILVRHVAILTGGPLRTKSVERRVDERPAAKLGVLEAADAPGPTKAWCHGTSSINGLGKRCWASCQGASSINGLGKKCWARCLRTHTSSPSSRRGKTLPDLPCRRQWPTPRNAYRYKPAQTMPRQAGGNKFRTAPGVGRGSRSLPQAGRIPGTSIALSNMV